MSAIERTPSNLIVTNAAPPTEPELILRERSALADLLTAVSERAARRSAR